MIKVGVATGREVQEIFNHAKQHSYALPAINVVNTSSINAVLESARDNMAPAMVQFSAGGCQFYSGKGLSNDNFQSAIAGGISGAMHVHQMAELYGATVILHTDHCAKKLLPWIDGLLDASEDFYKVHGKSLYSSHMIDLSEESLEENIEICKRYLERMSKMDMTLEIELGITGGEEDGVDNTHVDNSKLYTQPEEVAYAYEELSKISVDLQPKILKNSQEFIQNKYGTESNPVNFVFHGGSGSSTEDIREAIGYGVIKMNLDTDFQYAFNSGVRDYMFDKKDYINSQIGNPEGDDIPNKKYYDPRVWLRKGEEAFKARLTKAFEDLNNINTLK